MSKWVVCARCRHVLRPGASGTSTKEVETQPVEECPLCNLDDNYIDQEQEWQKEGDRERFKHWITSGAQPSLSEIMADPSLEQMEQMRRNRLYQDSIDNYKHLHSEYQADRVIKDSKSKSKQMVAKAMRGSFDHHPGRDRDVAVAVAQDKVEALENDITSKNTQQGKEGRADEEFATLPYHYGNPMVKDSRWHATQYAARAARVNSEAQFSAEDLKWRSPSTGLWDPNRHKQNNDSWKRKEDNPWDLQIPLVDWNKAPARKEPLMSVAEYNTVYDELPVQNIKKAPKLYILNRKQHKEKRSEDEVERRESKKKQTAARASSSRSARSTSRSQPSSHLQAPDQAAALMPPPLRPPTVIPSTAQGGYAVPGPYQPLASLSYDQDITRSTFGLGLPSEQNVIGTTSGYGGYNTPPAAPAMTYNPSSVNITRTAYGGGGSGYGSYGGGSYGDGSISGYSTVNITRTAYGGGGGGYGNDTGESPSINITRTTFGGGGDGYDSDEGESSTGNITRTTFGR